MNRPLTWILWTSLISAPSLANDVIISNFSSGIGTGTTFGGGATTIYKAFGFTMGGEAYGLEEVILTMDITGAMIDPLLEIRADAGGTPGSVLFALDDPAVLVGSGDFTFSASTPFVLDAGVSYWLYLQSVPMAGDVFGWSGTNPSVLPSGAGATALNYEFNGGVSLFFNRLEIRGSLASPGTNYCDANANSTGVPAQLGSEGSNVAADNDVRLIASNLPPLSFGFFIVGQTQGFVAMPGGSSGNLCVTGEVGRYVGPGQIQQSSGSGTFDLVLDLAMTPQPTGPVAVAAGETWNFQTWYRDTSPAGPTSNFTDGLSIDFQ